MCQLLTVTVKNNKNAVKECVFSRGPKIKWLLNERGKGVYSFTAINTSSNEEVIMRCYDEADYDNTWDKFEKKF